MSPTKGRPPRTRRVASGGGHRYYVDGKDYGGRGVTTLLKDGFPKPALVYWSARCVADLALYERNLWEPLVDAGRVEAAHQLLRDAPWSAAREAAARGTDVHRIAAQLAQGATVDVDDRTASLVDAYLAFRADWQPLDELVEVMVVNRRHQYAGTLDLLGLLEGMGRDGQPKAPDDGEEPARVLIDVKTGAKDVYAETALQLAAYRNAETMLPGGEGNLVDEAPMPAVDWTGALWLHDDGTYDLVPVNTDRKVFRVFLYAAEIAGFQGHKRGEGWGEKLLGAALEPVPTTNPK